MTASLTDRLAARLVEQGREVAGIYADPFRAAQIKLEDTHDQAADQGPRLGEGPPPSFMGYPIKLSPKSGVWIILHPRGEEPTEIEV